VGGEKPRARWAILLHARSLGPREKTRAFGMTPAFYA